MAYKACFSCELLFEVDAGLGDSDRCPQCGGVISDYQPSQDELSGRAQDVAPAPTQATPAIVRTMSYKGLAAAVREQIASGGNAAAARPVPRGRQAPRGRGPVARSGIGPAPTPRRPTIPPRGGLIPARPTPAPATPRKRPDTAPLQSLSGGDLDEPTEAQAIRPETAPIASVDMSSSALLGEPPAAKPVMAAPVIPSRAAPAVPVAIPAKPAPVIPARPVAAARPVPTPAVPRIPDAAAESARPDGRQKTKVLDSVDAADGTAAEDSVIEDVSMHSMVTDHGSVLEDISMQSVVEEVPQAQYDLPATVALQADPNRPLPPIPGKAPASAAPLLPPEPAPAFGATPSPVAPKPAMPSPIAPKPAMPSPIAPKPAMPQPVGPSPVMPQPVGPSPVMPRPAGPQPASPFAAPRPAQPAPVMPGAPAPAPMAAPSPAAGMPIQSEQAGADAFAPVAMGKVRKRSKAPLIIALVVILLGAAGAGVWFFVLRDAGGDTAETEAPPPPPELTWGEKLEQQIAAGQAPLPKVEAAAPLAESTWIAGGPEGMSTSLGLVTGMATSVIREGAAQSDDAGSFIPAVQRKLAEGSPSAETTLLLGFPDKTTVSDLLTMADSGRRAGHGAFALIVDQAEAPGTLGILPFQLVAKGGAMPEKGAVVVRVGRTGLHVTARGADNKRLPEAPPAEEGADALPPADPRVPRKGDALDLDGFADRLVVLGSAHPDIDQVRLMPIPDMTLDDLSGLMARIYKGKDGKRFAQTALAQ